MNNWSSKPNWENLRVNETLIIRPLARTAVPEVRLNGWNIPPHELKHVPDHWLSYPEPPASIHFMLGILYSFLMVASIIRNGLVIWIFSLCIGFKKV